MNIKSDCIKNNFDNKTTTSALESVFVGVHAIICILHFFDERNTVTIFHIFFTNAASLDVFLIS